MIEETHSYEKLLVPFSIGKSSKDEVFFDVFPMDTGHLLLGRPCQFDRRAAHDRLKNTCSFTKDGKNIILVPLSSQQVREDQLAIGKKRKESIFATQGKVEKALCNFDEVLFLLGNEAAMRNEILSFPPQVRKLLSKFSRCISRGVAT